MDGRLRRTQLRQARAATRGKNLAISEWPTKSGPADYVLFIGPVPVAIMEAERKHRDVSVALQQSKRYSRRLHPAEVVELPAIDYGAQAECGIPFVFPCNGRHYLTQLAQQGGAWFCDVRRPENLGRVLDGWCRPEGLSGSLLQRDEVRCYSNWTPRRRIKFRHKRDCLASG